MHWFSKYYIIKNNDSKNTNFICIQKINEGKCGKYLRVFCVNFSRDCSQLGKYFPQFRGTIGTLGVIRQRLLKEGVRYVVAVTRAWMYLIKLGIQKLWSTLLTVAGADEATVCDNYDVAFLTLPDRREDF